MPLSIDLKNYTALVTGVTQGLGAGIAGMLARAGCNVAGCGKSDILSPGATSFIASVEKEGRRAFYLPVDVTDPAAVTQFVIKSYETFGKIDILVSNAGKNIYKGASECSLEEWQQNLDLNLSSHWVIAKACQPYLIQSGHGTIIIITSNHAFSTIPGCFPYNVTKTALLGLVRALAIEWGPEIKTVGLAPGFIDSPANDEWFKNFEDPYSERQKTIRRHPVQKMGSSDEIGTFCAFLASPFASFISGCTYVVDGGRLALLQDPE